MRMTEERILHTRMEGKQPRVRPRTTWIVQIREGIEMRRGTLEEIQEKRKWENKGGQECNSGLIYKETT